MVAENSIKMTILKAKFGSDIRKTSIHHANDLTLDDLLLMLQRIFAIKNGEDITLKYKDGDGDLITLGDDSDLLLALQEPSLSLEVFLGSALEQVKNVQKQVAQLQVDVQALAQSLASIKFSQDLESSQSASEHAHNTVSSHSNGLGDVSQHIPASPVPSEKPEVPATIQPSLQEQVHHRDSVSVHSREMSHLEEDISLDTSAGQDGYPHSVPDPHTAQHQPELASAPPAAIPSFPQANMPPPPQQNFGEPQPPAQQQQQQQQQQYAPPQTPQSSVSSTPVPHQHQQFAPPSSQPQQFAPPPQQGFAPPQHMGGPPQQQQQQHPGFGPPPTMGGGPPGAPPMGGPQHHMGGPPQQMGGPPQNMGGPPQQMGGQPPQQQQQGFARPPSVQQQQFGAPPQQQQQQPQQGFAPPPPQFGGPQQQQFSAPPSEPAPPTGHQQHQQQFAPPQHQQQMGGPPQGGPPMGGPPMGGPPMGGPPMGGMGGPPGGNPFARPPGGPSFRQSPYQQ